MKVFRIAAVLLKKMKQDLRYKPSKPQHNIHSILTFLLIT